jgi:hypothetical protein
MVVLGKGRGRGTTVKPPSKVAAPKPINLPSLRSENMGFDPSVSIIPAGGAGWGSGAKPSEESPREQPAPTQPPEPESPPPQPLKKEESSTGSSGSAWGRGAGVPVPPLERQDDKRPPPPQLAKEEFPSLGSAGHGKSSDYNLRPGCMYYLSYYHITRRTQTKFTLNI